MKGSNTSNRLSYEEAEGSPCAACKPSICCQYLQVDTFVLNTFQEVNKVGYYLNFGNIEVCLTSGWDVLVYYNYPCRNYDADDAVCRIHNAESQPAVCVHYNPYNCYYKKMRTAREQGGREMIWLDRARLDYLKGRLSFGEDRLIQERPGMEELNEAVTRIPYRVPEREELPEEVLLNGKTGLKSYRDFRSSCETCASYCCRNLLLPQQQKPTNYTTLDYLQYALSFPGIELGVTDEQWYIIVGTRCRHFDGKRCGVYDKKERPLLCRYYNAAQCLHKAYLGKAEPEGFLRIGYEEYERFVETFRFDDDGEIVSGYDVAALRAKLETGGREAA